METHCWLTSYDDVDNNRRPPRQVKSNEQYGLGRAEFHNSLIFSLFFYEKYFQNFVKCSEQKKTVFLSLKGEMKFFKWY